MEVKDEVQLTNVGELLIEHLDKLLDEFEQQQLILILIHDGDEVQ